MSLRYDKIEIFLYLFYSAVYPLLSKKKMQIKTRKIASVCIWKLYRCICMLAEHYGCVGFTRRDCWRPYVPAVDSYPPISANWSAGSRLIRRALCVLDFYSWKHFKFQWQNWLGIPLAIETISMRPFDNRANLPLPFLRQKSVSFPPFSSSSPSSASFFVQIVDID